MRSPIRTSRPASLINPGNSPFYGPQATPQEYSGDRSIGWSRNTVLRHLSGGEAVAKREPGANRLETLDPLKDYIKSVTERMLKRRKSLPITRLEDLRGLSPP